MPETVKNGRSVPWAWVGIFACTLLSGYAVQSSGSSQAHREETKAAIASLSTELKNTNGQITLVIGMMTQWKHEAREEMREIKLDIERELNRLRDRVDRLHGL